MIKIETNDEKLIDELNLVIKLFYSQEDFDALDITFFVQQSTDNLDIHTEIKSTLNEKIYTNDDKIIDTKFPDRYKKRYAKLLLFQCLQEQFPDKTLPWGSLTGIRPTKLYYELIKECNGDYMAAFNMLIDKFKVTRQKALLVKEIMKNQKLNFQR